MGEGEEGKEHEERELGAGVEDVVLFLSEAKEDRAHHSPQSHSHSSGYEVEFQIPFIIIGLLLKIVKGLVREKGLEEKIRQREEEYGNSPEDSQQRKISLRKEKVAEKDQNLESSLEQRNKVCILGTQNEDVF